MSDHPGGEVRPWSERRPTQYAHVQVFLAANGPGPWPCEFCVKPVPEDELVVHHRDENKQHNVPENLTATHRACHTTHHLRGKVLSDEHRSKLSEAHKGKGTKTHCKRGHDLSVWGQESPSWKGRRCILCRRMRDRKGNSD